MPFAIQFKSPTDGPTPGGDTDDVRDEPGNDDPAPSLFPAPLHITGLIVPPDTPATAVLLERRVVLVALVGRLALGLAVHHQYEFSLVAFDVMDDLE